MKIGDLVLYLGRPYYVRGFEPMSLPDRRALLEDAQTGERVNVPVDELEPLYENGGDPETA